MQPRTAEDFKVLYQELEIWRHNENQKIKNNDGLEEEERNMAQNSLLKKEVRLLQTIDRLKNHASIKNKDERIKSFLETISAPKSWLKSDGQRVIVDTPFTTRARELQELQRGLSQNKVSIDERLDILLHVKWTVKEFDCNLTREVVDLIDREADMLNRQRPENSLLHLRKRILNLFLQFIEYPEFNPEAIRYQKVPRDLMTVE